MINKISTIAIILVMMALNTFAQDSIYWDSLYPALLSIQSTVTNNNPANLAHTQAESAGYAQLGFANNTGNFKPSMLGKSNRKYYLDAGQCTVIGKSVFKGNFEYAQGKDTELNYASTNNPYRLTPYIMVDTVGNDQTYRESYSLQTHWASLLSSSFTLGLLVDYKVSLAAQDRDPRSESTVGQLHLKPGFIYHLNKIKLGGDILYSYYNEEIDLITVKANTMHRIYALTGLGTYSWHEAPTFNRLYKQHMWGGNIQLMAPKNSFTIGTKQFIETADDGRKESGATWSAIKNDSKLNGYEYTLSDVFKIHHNKNIHQLGIKGKMSQMIGTEILQTLEPFENTDTYNWLTYSQQDKYEKLSYQVELSYQLARVNHRNQTSDLLSIQSEYKKIQENYYVPASHIHFSSLSISTSYLRMFYLGKDQLTAEASLIMNNNLTKDISLNNSNVITRNITYPDYYFNTSNNWAAKLSLQYITQPSFIQNTIYLKGDYHHYASSSGYFAGKSRDFVQLGLGLLF